MEVFLLGNEPVALSKVRAAVKELPLSITDLQSGDAKENLLRADFLVFAANSFDALGLRDIEEHWRFFLNEITWRRKSSGEVILYLSPEVEKRRIPLKLKFCKVFLFGEEAALREYICAPKAKAEDGLKGRADTSYKVTREIDAADFQRTNDFRTRADKKEETAIVAAAESLEKKKAQKNLIFALKGALKKKKEKKTYQKNLQNLLETIRSKPDEVEHKRGEPWEYKTANNNYGRNENKDYTDYNNVFDEDMKKKLREKNMRGCLIALIPIAFFIFWILVTIFQDI